MKKFLIKKRKLSESSEDADDPGVFVPSPVRHSGGSEHLPHLVAGFSEAPPGHVQDDQEGEGHLGSYSTEMGFQGFGAEFKRPRMGGDGEAEETRGRRFSQASTNSSASFCDDEGSVDRDAALLSRTLDSTSSSDTEDDFSHQKQGNGFHSKEQGGGIMARSHNNQHKNG